MSKEAIKMADVFNLPVKTNLMTDEHVVVIRGDDAWHLEDDNFWMLSGDHHMEAAAHAVNTHDALVQERDEWKESSEFNYQQYNDLMTQTVKDSEESERINDALVQHNAELTEALKEAVAQMEGDMHIIEHELGSCRRNEELYADGDISDALIKACAALSKEQG